MAAKSKHSKRTALRFKLPHKNITYMAKGQLGRATLQNISTGGCCATKNTTALSVNDQLLIVIELPECDRPLELKAKVVRVEDKGFSAEFTDIEESFVPRFATILAMELRDYQLNLVPIMK